MIAFRRLPVRARLTAGFAVAMAAIIALFAFIVHATMSAVLLDEVDTGLRSRAATIESGLPGPLHLAAPTGALIESREAFAQLLGPTGSVLESTGPFTEPMLAAAEARAVTRPRFFDRRLQGVAGGARLLVVPVRSGSARYVVVVGSSLSDRADALHLLERVFLIGGPFALALACVVGWLVAGVALRPVERMRRQAAAISATGRDRRLEVPEADDELSRLATTLNEMLDRIDDAVRAERRFLDNASHELRTPLTVLKAELDLARSRTRSGAELSEVVERVSSETDRLVRMADDLLLLARAEEGQLRIRREETPLRALLESSAGLFEIRAAQVGVAIDVRAPDVIVRLDRRRMRQAIDNLVDNGLRFAETTIELRAAIDDATVSVTVADDGPGLPDAQESRAFTAFERIDRLTPSDADDDGAGLGLAIVRMIGEGHGGTVSTGPTPGGGLTVTMTIPREEPPVRAAYRPGASWA